MYLSIKFIRFEFFYLIIGNTFIMILLVDNTKNIYGSQNLIPIKIVFLRITFEVASILSNYYCYFYTLNKIVSLIRVSHSKQTKRKYCHYNILDIDRLMYPFVLYFQSYENIMKRYVFLRLSVHHLCSTTVKRKKYMDNSQCFIIDNLT